MSGWRESVLSFSALPEVGPLLLASDPAWIWSRDGSRILWANPAGGARLGAANVANALRRRWPENHPLRREVEGLFRAAPEKGTLARLRIVDDSRSLPVAARVRRIRAGDERGLLIVAIEGAAAALFTALRRFLRAKECRDPREGRVRRIRPTGGAGGANHLIRSDEAEDAVFMLEGAFAAEDASPAKTPALTGQCGLSMARRASGGAPR